MQSLFTPDQMRAFDGRAISEFGIPGPVLMENAALQALAVIEQEYGDVELLSVAVLCGPGNNGGDGFALARQLFLRGCDVDIWLFSDPQALAGDAKTNYEIARKLAISILTPAGDEDLDFGEYDLIVDALLGTGLTRAPEGLMASVIELLNETDLAVIALDIPSGVDGGTGATLGHGLDATHTVTFQCGKPGLYLYPGRKHAGQVHVVPISLPLSVDDLLKADYYVPEHEDVASLFPNRPLDAHKGSFGRLLVVAGSRGLSGAARLCGAAALRSGVGLVTMAIPESTRSDVARQPELMTIPLPETAGGCLSAAGWSALEPYLAWADAIAVGPGLGKASETVELLEKLLATTKPLVIDADGLNLIAAHKLQAQLPRGTVLTPHPGELERLVGRGLPTDAQRIAAARELAQSRQVTVLVKGATSATVTPDGKVYLNVTGNPGLASGGSGDVLTGIIGALLAQGAPAGAAAWGGAYLHGLAADVAADVLGEVAMLPSDVITYLPSAIAELNPKAE
ncbi:MAG: NAD(P)H-hydrate dehydratase [bacterium]|nr:NAD(P)H-hydrate dehydratase [bacterium]